MFSNKMNWNAGAQPNLFQHTILLYRGKRAGLQLTLQNIFAFLFLGNDAQEVFP